MNKEVFFVGTISTHCVDDCRGTNLALRVNRERDIWVDRSLAAFRMSGPDYQV